MGLIYGQSLAIATKINKTLMLFREINGLLKKRLPVKLFCVDGVEYHYVLVILKTTKLL